MFLFAAFMLGKQGAFKVGRGGAISPEFPVLWVHAGQASSAPMALICARQGRGAGPTLRVPRNLHMGRRGMGAGATAAPGPTCVGTPGTWRDRSYKVGWERTPHPEQTKSKDLKTG